MSHREVWNLCLSFGIESTRVPAHLYPLGRYTCFWRFGISPLEIPPKETIALAIALQVGISIRTVERTSSVPRVLRVISAKSQVHLIEISRLPTMYLVESYCSSCEGSQTKAIIGYNQKDTQQRVK